MEISLNSIKDTLRITSESIQLVLRNRDFTKITFGFESCANSELAASCSNGQDTINSTANFTVQIPKVEGLFVYALEVYSVFADRTINLTPAPIYYDSNQALFVQSLQNQIINSFSSVGVDGSDVLLEHVDGTSFMSLTIKSLPLGWIGQLVRYNIDGHVKTDSFTHSITESLFASNSEIYIKSSLFGMTKFINDVLRISITMHLENGACITESACFYIDVDQSCILATRLQDLSENRLKLFLSHYGLQTASGCVTDCTDMCTLFNNLSSSLSNDC